MDVSAERCRRCLRCIFSCPTGAIRVHAAGPVLREGLCVGCTECAAACSSGVYGIRDVSAETPAALEKAVIVLPRSLLTSSRAGNSPAAVLAALQALGFSEVRFTEEWEEATRLASRALAAAAAAALPVITPICPAVTALVESRFPSLIPNLAPLASPLEAAGEEFPLRPAVLVAACPAQLAAAVPTSLTGRLTVLTPAALCAALRAAPASSAHPSLRAPREPQVPEAGELSASGPRDVLDALTAAEAGALEGVTLLDLRLCPNGCAGSTFVTPDPFLASLVSRRILPFLHGAPETDAGAVTRSAPYQQRAGLRLGADMAFAIQALGRMDELVRTLPGRDCGACGAPTCALFAEDLVMGRAESSSCPHVSNTREVSP